MPDIGTRFGSCCTGYASSKTRTPDNTLVNRSNPKCAPRASEGGREKTSWDCVRLGTSMKTTDRRTVTPANPASRAVMEESQRRGVQVSAVHLWPWERFPAWSRMGFCSPTKLHARTHPCRDHNGWCGGVPSSHFLRAESAGASAAIAPTFLVSRLRHPDDGPASRERT